MPSGGGRYGPRDCQTGTVIDVTGTRMKGFFFSFPPPLLGSLAGLHVLIEGMWNSFSFLLLSP
jgi:hypothetical protein